MLSAVSLETEFIKTEFVSINVISPDEFFSTVTISEYLTPLFIASETEEFTADMAKDSTFAAQILTRTAEKELVIETIAAIIARNKAKNITQNPHFPFLFLFFSSFPFFLIKQKHLPSFATLYALFGRKVFVLISFWFWRGTKRH